MGESIELFLSLGFGSESFTTKLGVIESDFAVVFSGKLLFSRSIRANFVLCLVGLSEDLGEVFIGMIGVRLVGVFPLVRLGLVLWVKGENKNFMGVN